MAHAFTFCRGDTIALALQCTSGDPTMVTSVRATLRPALYANSYTPSGLWPSSATLVSYNPASSPALPYWLIAVPAANSAALSSGQYALDAELNISGIVVTTNAAMINLQEPSTTPPTGTIVPGTTWTNGSVTTPSGTIALQWVNDTDATASVFQAINLTIDPNLISLLG